MRVPSSGREPHSTTLLRDNTAVHHSKNDCEMAELGSKPVSLGVSKCFPVCPRKRTSDPSQSAPGIIPHTQEHAPSHGGALGRALARRARPRLRHPD
jgi:hypothetical protein